jgi:tRNA (cmo5U34)-methyltransferase
MKTDKSILIKKTWKFNSNVTKSFDKHIKKSVPFYEISHEITCDISKFFLKENSVCYDIGCSTGTLLNKIKLENSGKKLKFIGVDESKAMIKLAKKKFKNISFINSELEKIKFIKNDLITSLYTMQFVKPKTRQHLFDKIYKSLNWGGAFIMFEKIRGSDARFQDILNFNYFDFKKKMGFSEKEILNKEISLRGVLEPYTIQANMDFLKRSGFRDIMPISQYLCFVGFLSIK